jgi:hypothetical protein
MGGRGKPVESHGFIAPSEPGPPVERLPGPELDRKPGNAISSRGDPFAQSERSNRPLSLPGREQPAPFPLPSAGPATRSHEFFESEIASAVKGTITVIVQRALELVAQAHGLGGLVMAVKWVWKAVTWWQVGEGGRGVDVEVPIPLGSGIELDLSAHAGRSFGDTEPVVTFCFAPVSGRDPGVLVVNGCQISPGVPLHKELVDKDREAASRAREREAERAAMRTAEDEIRIVLVALDLSRLMSKEPDPQIRTAALMLLAKGQLIPELKERQLLDDLEAIGVECIACYDQETKDSIWLLLSGVEAQPARTRIGFDAAGRLMLWRP